MKFRKLTAVLLAGAMASSLALSGCGDRIDQDAVGATIGDQEISIGYMNFVAHYTQINYDSIFVSYYGEDYWTSESYTDDDGLTMEDTVKEYVLEEIELECLLEAHMEDYGVEITDEDMEAIRAAAEEFMSENSSAAISAMGAAQEYVETYLYYETLASRMEDAIYDDAEAQATEQLSIEDYSRRTFSYIEIDYSDYTDDDGETVSYTEDEIAAFQESAAEFAASAQAGEDFDTLADTYGYTVSTYSYGEDEDSEEDGGFSDAVIASADTLTAGQISGVIEGTDCYYVIRLDSEDDEEAAQSALETAITELADELYTEVTDGYQEESDFEVDEDQWAKVKFSKLFTIDDGEDDDSSVSAE
ncbi:MAG: peptidyl-prolyl cis-trans isomerase [Lachnospiraceae bacterium]|nr:peptidyl-prolyl cis-trans isomerase [Lachnospiraceae bacterium]